MPIHFFHRRLLVMTTLVVVVVSLLLLGVAAEDEVPKPSSVAFSFSLWPPPPSTFSHDCYLQLDSCVQDLTATKNATVAVTIVCPQQQQSSSQQKYASTTLLVNRTDYLRLAVQHQQAMARDFCRACDRQCNTKDNGNQQQQQEQQSAYYSSETTYQFLPRGSQPMITKPNNKNNTNHYAPVYYECEACLQDCQTRAQTSASLLVETAVNYSNCGPLYPEKSDSKSYSVGPICVPFQEESMTSGGTSTSATATTKPSTTIGFGIFESETGSCLSTTSPVTSTFGDEFLSAETLEKKLDIYFPEDAVPLYSNAMWNTITTRSFPLSCVPTTTTTNDPSSSSSSSSNNNHNNDQDKSKDCLLGTPVLLQHCVESVNETLCQTQNATKNTTLLGTEMWTMQVIKPQGSSNQDEEGLSCVQVAQAQSLLLPSTTSAANSKNTEPWSVISCRNDLCTEVRHCQLRCDQLRYAAVEAKSLYESTQQQQQQAEQSTYVSGISYQSSSSYASWGWCQQLADVARSCDQGIISDGIELAQCHRSSASLSDEPTLPADLPIIIPQEASQANNMDQYYDLTGSSVQFRQCVVVRSEEMDQTALDASISLSSAFAGAGAGAAATPTTASTTNATATTTASRKSNLLQYVLFQMCLGGHNHTRDGQSCQHEEQDCQDYVVDLETYLRITTRQLEDNVQKACRACSTYCSDVTVEWGQLETSYETTTAAIEHPFVGLACDYCPVMTPNGKQDSDNSSSSSTEQWSPCWPRNDGVYDWYASDDAVDCELCSNECDKIVLREANGYVADTEFVSCQMIYDPDGDDGNPFFAGPLCANNFENKVRIEVFRDELCQDQDPTQVVDDYLFDSDGHPMKMSYKIMRHVTGESGGNALSCYVNTPTSTNPRNAQYEINNMCRDLKLNSFSCRDGKFGSDGVADADSVLARSINLDMAAVDFIKSLCPGSESSVLHEGDEGSSTEPNVYDSTGGVANDENVVAPVEMAWAAEISSAREDWSVLVVLCALAGTIRYLLP